MKQTETQYQNGPASYYVGIKILFNYDSKGNLVLKISHDWDHDTKTLIPDMKYEYQYDKSNKKVVEIIYSNFTKKWTKSSKIEFNYDEKDNLTLSEEYMQQLYEGPDDKLVMDWCEHSQHRYLYNSKGQLTLKQLIVFHSASYPKPIIEEVYTYNNHSQILIIKRKQWDSHSDSWGAFYSSEEYTYH